VSTATVVAVGSSVVSVGVGMVVVVDGAVTTGARVELGEGVELGVGEVLWTVGEEADGPRVLVV
jgi:hypothetical protein